MALPIPLPDSSAISKEMTDLQRSIVDQYLVDTSLTGDEIAELVGCSRSTVYKTFNKQHVKEYVLGQVNARLIMASLPAIMTKHQLLSSKSDYIKDKASSDILDRNAIGVDTSIKVGNQVMVKIDLS